MVTLLETAEQLGLDFVELTSRPRREAANGLYRSLGFELRPTNVYCHRLQAIPAAVGRVMERSLPGEPATQCAGYRVMWRCRPMSPCRASMAPLGSAQERLFLLLRFRV